MRRSGMRRARSRRASGWRASVSPFRSSRASRRSSSRESWPLSAHTSTVADRPVNDAPYRLINDVEFGENVVVHAFTNIYGCAIGDNTRIGSYVEDQRGAVIGANCKIQSHSFICDGVTIEDGVFIGHGVMFINDK